MNDNDNNNLPKKSQGSLLNLITVLTDIDLDSELAKLNEKSISDNNGGRIEL